MRHLFVSAALLLCASAFAQTTINVTLPGTQGSCTYTTGPVLSNSIPGQLQATATSFAGAGCGGGIGGVSFGPASPLTPSAITLPGTSGTVNFSFQPVNATQCTGSITGATGGAFNGSTTLCNGAACNSLVSAPATFTNSSTTANAVYNVAVTCTGAGSPATSTAAVTVPFVNQPPPTCTTIPSSVTGQTFTQLTGNQTVFYFGSGAGSGNQIVDVTSFDSFWFSAWPGQRSTQPVPTLPANKYLSMQFKVPAGYFETVPGNTIGEYYVGTSLFVASISMTISTGCGDFSPSAVSGSTVVAGCYANLAPASSGMFWRTPTGATCKLQDGQTYYLNFINANITNVTPTGGTAKSVCATASCTDPLLNGGNF
jgi:hypothetical protein